MWLNTTGEIFSILSFLHFRRQVWVWDWRRGRWCRCLLVQVATFIFDHIVLVDQDSGGFIIVILRDGKKINVEDGRVEIVVDGKTRKLIFKVGRIFLVTVMTVSCPTTSSSSSSSSPTRTPTSRTRERSRARQTKILPLVNSKWLVSSNNRDDHFEQWKGN